jgi:hypothetical protein
MLYENWGRTLIWFMVDSDHDSLFPLIYIQYIHMYTYNIMYSMYICTYICTCYNKYVYCMLMIKGDFIWGFGINRPGLNSSRVRTYLKGFRHNTSIANGSNGVTTYTVAAPLFVLYVCIMPL